jgi:hypothetical protein
MTRSNILRLCGSTFYLLLIKYSKKRLWALRRVWVPYTVASWGAKVLLVRSQQMPMALTDDVRQAVRATDAGVALAFQVRLRIASANDCMPARILPYSDDDFRMLGPDSCHSGGLQRAGVCDRAEDA